MEFAQSLDPKAIYISGWVDKNYLQVGKTFRRKGIPIICGLDNQWFGSLKQRLASWISPFYLKPIFSHIWAAGTYQYEFAHRMGYERHEILRGVYSADVEKFAATPLAYPNGFPHRFVYVGRLVKVKGIQHFSDAIRQLNAKHTHDWEFLIFGKGPEEKTFEPLEPNVKMIGFVQPDELAKYAQEGGVFVLPSTFEPWGVVVHEFAAAGFPVLVSDACGASTAFLRNGYNGYAFRPNHTPSLLSAFEKIIHSTDDALIQMGHRSRELARSITPDTWAATLFQTLNS